MRASQLAVGTAAILALAAPASRARAQGIVPEARIDAIIAHQSVLQAALGLDIPISSGMRLELAAGAGPSFSSHFTARGDAVVHFLLDPRHLMRWSPYAGGGIGARYYGGGGGGAGAWRATAILVAGVNAPRWKHAVPFIEAGLGRGFRLGAGLRRGDTRKP